MKTKDISKQHGLDHGVFEAWLKQSGLTYKSGALGGIDVDDRHNVAQVVQQFQHHLAESQAAATRAQAEWHVAQQQKQQALARMLVTSGFGFEGYAITRYAGYVSGDDIMQVDRGREGIFAQATNVGGSLMASLTGLRRSALDRVLEAAYALGCNAVVGLDFDYLTLDPETVNSHGGTLYLPYVFGVTANANAVVIEPRP